MTEPDISFSKRVVIAPDTLINVIGNEAVLLNLNNEQYYGLDKMGMQFWKALTDAPTIQAAYESLLGGYEVSADALQRDLRDLLGKLLANGLVELHGE